MRTYILKLFGILTVLGILAFFFFLNPGSSRAQIGGCPSCTGPIYCTGPCGVLWYPPNNCGCEASLCNYYDNLLCPSAPAGCLNGDCCANPATAQTDEPYRQCDNCQKCGNVSCAGECPAWINPCINICAPTGTPAPTPGPGPTSTPTPTPTPTPIPVASCTLTFSPSPISMAAGDTANVTANVTPLNGTVDNVFFSIVNPSIATLSPTNDSSSPYQTVVTGLTPGTTELRASVYMGGVLTCGGALPIDPVSVSNSTAWWQVIDGDVITNGDLISPIPSTCSLPVCNPAFVVTGLGGAPGVPSYQASFDFNSGLGTGTVSDTGWITRSNYQAQTDYNYAYFLRLVPGDAVLNNIPDPTINPNYLKNQGTVSPDGYIWYFRTGDLTMQGEPILAGNKVVLFVNGNLTIDGIVDLTPGQGFFMAIASGNITINPGLDNPGGGAELEGIFVSDQNFITVPDTAQLAIRGMVAAYQMVDLGRSLPDNTQNPAELFEYAPDLLFNMPASLQLKRTRWKEVAP